MQHIGCMEMHGCSVLVYGDMRHGGVSIWVLYPLCHALAWIMQAAAHVAFAIMHTFITAT